MDSVAGTNAVNEFEDANEVLRFHRYGLSRTDEGVSVYFTLLGADGVEFEFSIGDPGIWDLTAELYELARAARHLRSSNDLAGFAPAHAPGTVHLSADGFIAPFLGPMMKLHRAKVHFVELDELLLRYGRVAKIVPVEVSSTDDQVTWRLDVSEAPPRMISLMIGDTVHNLRSALDLTMADIARTRGQDIGRLQFPFAKTESDLDKIICSKNGVERLGPDVVQAIKDQKPYAGGNELLYGLHLLDISDKHKLIIPAFHVEWRQHDMGLRLADLYRAENREPPNVVFAGDQLTPLNPGTEITSKRGEDPLRYYKEPKPLVPMFPHAEVPFRGAFVMQTLERLFAVTRAIVQDFRERFDK